ncbi:MAG TPA: hypothetical protein VFR25_07060 [Candidatus Eisenbacteria bacterium]|nr:hypothetical protein [Candidatus Eisenbacteria bacterium]
MSGGALRRWALLAPPLAAIALALPMLRLGYFWDDYYFLTRAQHGLAACLEYVQGAAFYRPLTQGLYFLPLAGAGSAGAIASHLANLVLLAVSAWLLAIIIARHAGTRAGLLAGLLFAGIAPAASLVGWASGAQDLAAILFFLVALDLHDRGHTAWAVIAMLLALLSKEAIGAALPVFVLWDLLLGRKPARVLVPLLAFGAVAVAWAALHPGIQLLVTGRLNEEPRSYVGFQNHTMVFLEWRRYWRALFNTPATGLGTPWPVDRIAYSAAAWIVGVLALVLTHRQAGHGGTDALTPRRAVLLGALLTIPALLLPSLVVRRWAAYFVCIPALGTSIALGVVLARAEAAVSAFALAVYLALGLWSRGVHDPSGALLTERSFIEGERATRDLERKFREFYPTLPHGTQVLVSVAASGMAGTHGTLVDGQAPRIWYDDATIRVLDPERRVAGTPHEILLRVTEARDLIQIDPDIPSVRSSGAPARMPEIRIVIGTYARGVAATGDPDRAVRILLRLANTEPYLLVRAHDQRLAAMVLYARGDSTGAEQILRSVPPLPRGIAIDAIARVLAQPSRSPTLDAQAYRVFGISPRDPDALRYWMAMFYGAEYFAQAKEMARRLQEVKPGDKESAEVLAKLQTFPTNPFARDP